MYPRSVSSNVFVQSTLTAYKSERDKTMGIDEHPFIDAKLLKCAHAYLDLEDPEAFDDETKTHKSHVATAFVWDRDGQIDERHAMELFAFSCDDLNDEALCRGALLFRAESSPHYTEEFCVLFDFYESARSVFLASIATLYP